MFKNDNINGGEQTGVRWRGMDGGIMERIISCESESRSLQAREQIEKGFKEKGNRAKCMKERGE